MTDKTPADMIEQAADVIRNVTASQYPDARDSYDKWARALHDAGLLADPANRDEPYDQLDNQRNLWAKQCHEAEARAERAEAELSNMEADYDRRGERLWRLAAKAGYEPSESDNDASAELTIETALAELQATVNRVRGLADRLDSPYSNPSVRYMSTRIREALDGGEQHD